MRDQTTILVPLRYPLTDRSVRTLSAAGRVTADHAPASLRILHVNLYQNGQQIGTPELRQAVFSTLDDIEATLDGVETSVVTRQSFLVEEAILEEATQIDADVIVLGTDQHARWQRLLRRLLGTDPNIGPFLRQHSPADTEIFEVGAAAEPPTAEAF